MARKRSAEDLSEEELRQLLLDRRRTARQARLDHFHQTGRVTGAAAGPFEAQQPVDEPESGYDEEDGTTSRINPRRRRRRQTLDTFLFLVEIAAILGLLFIFLNGYTLLRELNREVAAALVPPTQAPAPRIAAVVLPDGHIPPDGTGESRPNEAEIPEHLRPVAQSLASQPVPTRGPSQAVRIQIPAINIDAPVVQGDGWEQLKKGVAQHAGTANPGEPGNLVLSAHNDVYGELFRDLDRLKVGDEFTIFTADRQFVYRVVSSHIVEPTQVDVMGATEQATATLISCYPYLIDNKRIVVKAELKLDS